MNAGREGNRDAFAEFYFGAEASDNVLVGEDFVFSVLHHQRHLSLHFRHDVQT